MKGVIKGSLYEELQNSIRMKKEYEDAIKKLPKGCLSIKKIKGYKYCYIVKRVNGKLHYCYKGKMSQEEINKYLDIKKMRAKYRNLLSKVKKQIKYLRGVLRGKKPI